MVNFEVEMQQWRMLERRKMSNSNRTVNGGIVNNTLRPPVPASCDLEWRKLMEQCWAPDPVQRPSFTQIASRLRTMSVASQTKPAK